MGLLQKVETGNRSRLKEVSVKDLNTESNFILAEQVNLLYQNFWTGIAGIILASILFTATMWGRTDTTLLLVWMAAVWVIVLIRSLLVRSYFQTKPAADQLRPWVYCYIAGTSAAGSIWGLTAFLFINGTDETGAMLVMLFIAAISAAGTALFAPVLKAVQSFLLTILLPLNFRLFLMEDQVYRFMAVAAVVYLVVLLIVARRNYMAIQNVIQTSMENQRLKEDIVVEKLLVEKQEETVAILKALEQENELFHNVVEHTRDLAITVHDLEDRSRITYANNAACKHFGVDKDTLLTWTTYDFDPHFSDGLFEDVKANIKSGQSMTFETEHRVSGGKIILVEVVLNPLEQNEGLFAVSYFHDIRDRKALEEQRLKYEAALARHEIEERFRSLVEAIPDAIVCLDVQARYVYLSPLASALIDKGVSPLKKTVLEVSITGNKESDVRLYEAAMSAIENGEEGTYEDWWLLPEHKAFFEIHYIPEKDDSGKVLSLLVVARDITERTRIENTLQFVAQRGWSEREESFQQALARHLAEILDVSYVVVDKLGDKPGEVKTAAFFAKGKILPNEHYNLKGTPCENVMDGTLCSYSNDVQQLFPDDEMLPEMGVESYIGLPLCDSSGEVIGLIAVMDEEPLHDVTTIERMLKLVASRAAAELERERSEQALKTSEREYRRLLNNSPDVIVRYDNECRRTYSNDAHRKILSKPVSLGSTPTEEWGLPDEKKVAINYQANLNKVMETGKPNEWELKWNDVNETSVCFLVRGVPEFDKDRNVSGVLVIARNISERLRMEEEMRHQASYDSLTNMPNRRLFGDRLNEEIIRAERNGENVALLFIDLDRFKEINDMLGHHIGDQLLVEAAERIHSCMRKSDTVARLGGDEFVAILPNIKEIAHIGSVAQNIINALAQPYTINEHVTYISASIGIAGYPRDAENAEALLSCADRAMYKAKENGRNGFSFFTASMQAQAESRLYLAHDLRSALSQEQCQVHYQPIVEVKTGRVVKAEALLRWQHPKHGTVPPDKYIPLAEETGIIHELGNWVLDEAIETARRWQEQYKNVNIQMSINISPRQFLRDQVVENWLKQLRKTDMPTECLVMEITEGLLLDDQLNVMTKLGKLREAGIQIALDDFGTGYSAMAYLKRFNIDYLKIDRSFIRDLTIDENDRAIAETIVVMAKRLGLKTIAEGVETAEQRDLLAAVGCDYVQGYLYARPIPADEFLQYVNDNAKGGHT